jgi:hypothetical protein
VGLVDRGGGPASDRLGWVFTRLGVVVVHANGEETIEGVDPLGLLDLEDFNVGDSRRAEDGIVVCVEGQPIRRLPALRTR